MKTAANALRILLLLSFATLFLAGCDRSASDLDADARPIPSMLSAGERQAYRRLPFEGANNFRDLGGYKTTDGRTLKWGMVYRSDKLSDLSSEDELYMERLGLKRIVDFRTATEREAEPDRIAPASSIAIERRPISVSGADFNLIKNKIESGNLEPDEFANLLVDGNRELVEAYTHVYRDWFQSMLDPASLPMMFHCTAGKDRTGFGAALILLSLGVPMETVMQDYMATNTYTADHIERVILIVKLSSFFQTDGEALRPLLGVEPRFLEEAFKAINERYGSIDNYIDQGLDLDAEKLEKLRKIFLESA